MVCEITPLNRVCEANLVNEFCSFLYTETFNLPPLPCAAPAVLAAPEEE